MKSKASKLDQHAERLDEWELQKLTLEKMAGELHELGCDVSLSRLSAWLQSRRQERLQKQMLTTIASGGRMNKEIDEAFERNPAPEIEQLIRLSKTLIMSLQVQGVAEPEMLKLANSMQQTVLNYLSGQTKAALEERKLSLGERRVAMLEQRMGDARTELQKIRDPKAPLGDEERKAIIDKVDEILGLK